MRQLELEKLFAVAQDAEVGLTGRTGRRGHLGQEGMPEKMSNKKQGGVMVNSVLLDPGNAERPKAKRGSKAFNKRSKEYEKGGVSSQGSTTSSWGIGSVSQFLVERVILCVSQCLFFVVFSLCHLHPHPPRRHPNPLPDPLLPLASRLPCRASALVFFFLCLGGKFFRRPLAAISSMPALLQPLCRGDYFLPPRPARGTGALAHLSVPFRTGTITCT